MRNQKWLRAAFTGLSIQSAFATDPTVTFEKSQVTYRGTQKGSVEDFHNIKFAHDTSGKNRFAPPRPYTPSEGSVIDATVPGPACPQLKAGIPPFFSETPDQSEDCRKLYLDFFLVPYPNYIKAILAIKGNAPLSSGNNGQADTKHRVYANV